jgi:hypothetical protein
MVVPNQTVVPQTLVPQQPQTPAANVNIKLITGNDNSTNTFKGMANVSGVVSVGSYLPSGTYFFKLSYPNECEKSELKGFIHIDNKL